ncbi:MAG TPA: HAMP domain-containing sensor histidine kinase [Kofleriaceae bacterium]
MAFEQDLRVYLESLERASPGNVPARHIDEHELHRHLLERLQRLENARAGVLVIRSLFDDWTGKLERFARYLEMLPRQLAPVDREGAIAFARRALDVALECLEPEIAVVDRLELRRIVGGFEVGATILESYALENHLVRRDDVQPARLTELGRVFLRLRGKDAVRWLMTGELAQSAGPRDPWHASRTLLEESLAVRGILRESLEDETYFEHSDQTLDRLTRLGVLSAMLDAPDGDVYEYRAAAAMRDVVQGVLDPGPWHTAVRALLDDERALVVPGAWSSAAEATIEQTRLIVHEVRNALIPVRHDIEALRSFATEHAQQQRIEDAKQGIARVLDFVEGMVQMSELITEPAVRCEIGTVIGEALRWSDPGRRVERRPAPEAIVLAPRGRLARAISNVVGNALQASTAAQPIRLSVERAGGVIRVLVDDGGPGVPAEHRARVFLEGVTMRQGEPGSGFGLAFARRVVEGELHGKIWCEDSDLGGARFVLEVPEATTA